MKSLTTALPIEINQRVTWHIEWRGQRLLVMWWTDGWVKWPSSREQRKNSENTCANENCGKRNPQDWGVFGGDLGSMASGWLQEMEKRKIQGQLWLSCLKCWANSRNNWEMHQLSSRWSTWVSWISDYVSIKKIGFGEKTELVLAYVGMGASA